MGPPTRSTAVLELVMRKNVQHSFARVPGPEIQRSVFARDFGVKTTGNFGWIYPCFVDEVLPGDTFEMRATLFGRLSTLLHPVLENMYVDMFFFFVPTRLVWDDWARFNGEKDDPEDTTTYVVPQLQAASGFSEDSLGDYFGLPTKVTNLSVNALPFRAYNLIYNEWFRDQNLIAKAAVYKDAGPDLSSEYRVQRRMKRHDYFTASLPWPMKGDPVLLPLGATAPVTGSVSLSPSGNPTYNVAGSTNGPFTHAGSGAQGVNYSAVPNGGGTGTESFASPGLAATFSSGVADLANATAATINDLRQAFQVQRLLERDARGGTRYAEIVRSHFGVVSPDGRLQRPEYLGGGTARISVNPVASTTYNTANTLWLGDLGANGVVGAQNGFRQSFTEHGYVIGLWSARADLNYQEGIERMWSRETRYDFYWPSFAHLGEQAVLNKEIFAQGTAADDDVFGYQERFAEYRYKPSRVSGRMRSNCTTPLDSWHLVQEFGELPTLNEDFMIELPPVDRILAVSPSLEPALLVDFAFQFRCARPMPTFSVPGLIDHF